MAEHSPVAHGLSESLSGASDRAVVKITAVIDRLPERGAADQLLEGVRPRLRMLRPPRPRSLSRLLFMPLHPVIVPGRQWRPGDACIPRSIIAPIVSLITANISDPAALNGILSAAGDPDPRLWSLAAQALTHAFAPPGWAEPAFQARTGIPPQEWGRWIETIRLLFCHAQMLRNVARGQEPAFETVRPLLLHAARLQAAHLKVSETGPSAWTIALALLFEQTTAPGPLLVEVRALTRTADFGRQLDVDLYEVIETVVSRLEEALPEPAVSDAALDALARHAMQLAAYGALRGDRLAIAGRLAAGRRRMIDFCGATLDTGLFTAAEICGLVENPTPRQQRDTTERLEGRLRAFRRLDLAGRLLGDDSGREALLCKAAAFYAGLSQPAWLNHVDRLRLCEILVGAEAGMQIMKSS